MKTLVLLTFVLLGKASQAYTATKSCYENNGLFQVEITEDRHSFQNSTGTITIQSHRGEPQVFEIEGADDTPKFHILRAKLKVPLNAGAIVINSIELMMGADNNFLHWNTGGHSRPYDLTCN